MKPLGVFAAAGVLLAVVPFLGLPAFYESFLYLVFHWAVLATSWNLLSGYSGYFSFGHAAFFGAGVYSTAVLAGKLGWPFLLTLPVAAAVPALLGAALGAVVFRVHALRGELFALITLALMFVFSTIVLNTPIDGGPGVYLSAVAVPAIAPTPSGSFYLMALVLALGTIGIAYAVFHSRFGTGLFAIHDDEDVAEVMGVPTYRYKLAALALSCGLAGLAGGVHGIFVSYVTVGETFSGWMALNVILMAALGGTRHWLGPAVGAAAVTLMTFYFTTSEYAIAGRAAVGLIFIAVILFMPQGLLGRLSRRKSFPRGKTEELSKIKAITTDAILVVRGVSKAFKGVQALDGIELEVRRGEILGLVGPNGSGKSTLINVVSGHYRCDAGSLMFEGRELSGVAPHRIARGGIARTYQIPRPFPHLTVLENVALPPMFGQVVMERRAAESEAWRWLAFTGLENKAERFPADLNLHERKFLELARALASRPKLLFLDEVLSGLTPAEMDEAIRLVRAIREQGATIVFVEHVMRAVMELTDRIVVLTYGRTIAQGTPRDVMRDPLVIDAYLGTAHA
ncbi:MAG TPA: branched-chain amino acid ABC transporter ATP-binding protein/permease [Burkholderiales bacterium]